MEEFNHKDIEKKWQNYWHERSLHTADEHSSKPHSYILDMFPYPSGAGLHVGHPKGYTATDILSRYLRMKGKEVLHPIGWDAFGLPAENYAIKEGMHPLEVTHKNIPNFKRQIQSFGFSYDWDRELNTSDPSYYKWTQWFFLLLYKKGLAYKKKASVNWCPSCHTVLAREQVVQGACERCGTEVVQKEREQWFFKITQYADRLLNGLDSLQWPESITSMQRHWIGRSEGAQISFPIEGKEESIPVFTTRPDTLEGATYLVLAPEHELVDVLTTDAQANEVQEYVALVGKKTELQRTDLAKEKTGVFLGSYAINPLTQERIPVWIGDHIIVTYGTGAIMAVPSHDERDKEFAQKFGIPSREFQLGDSDEIVKKVGGSKEVRYRLRDWLISRQRYWGAPIPIVYCDVCGMVPVPEADLPVELPMDVDFRPTGESPLSRSESFHAVKCPICKAPARREVDTMDTFVCSSWYFLRFCDPHNKEKAFDPKKVALWMPVDMYVGGAEHAVLHLMYARFFTYVLHDLGYVEFDEPFKVLRNVGLILAEDKAKMSKSKGNVINPDDIVNEYGADTFRMYEMFIGPFDEAASWNAMGVRGMRRFLNRVWDLHGKIKDVEFRDQGLLHKTMKKVGDDISRFAFNTAISSLMVLLKSLEETPSKSAYEIFISLLFPFAPHISEELWERLGHRESLTFFPWPVVDEGAVKEDKVTWVVQINGRTRGTVVHVADADKEEVIYKAKKDPKLAKYFDGATIEEVIFVPARLINVMMKSDTT